MTDTEETLASTPDDLLLQAIEDELDESQRHEFIGRLENSPADLTEFLNLHGEHRLLSHVLGRRDGAFVNRVMTDVLAVDTPAGTQPPAGAKSFWRMSSISAAAVAVAALLMVLVQTVLPQATEPVGLLQSATASVQVDGNPATVGMSIIAGAMVQTDDMGSGQIRLVDGSTIDLGAGTSAWIERRTDAVVVHVIAGRVDAAVARPIDGHHFSIVGDRASVTASDTHFTVWSDDQIMHVTVTHGEVAVVRHSDGNSVSLQPGQRASIANDGTFAVKSGRESSDQVTITDIALIDALHHQSIPAFTPLRDGSIIDLAALPSVDLNMLISASASVADVRVAVEGGDTSIRRRDQYRPFTVFGNVQQLYKSWTPVPGTYAIKITPHGYDLQDGVIFSLTFTVIDSRVP